MTPAITTTPKVMNAEALNFLASLPGPFITAVVPDRHPGAPEGSRRAIIQNLVKAAAGQLGATPFADQAADLLAPIAKLAQDPAITAGGPALAIFRSPDRTVMFRAIGHLQKLVIASHPYLTPFLSYALVPNDFFVLGLGTKHLRLFRYTHDECAEMDLPAGVPANMEEAGPARRGDQNLENHSPVGSNAGSLNAVRFGTGSDREDAGERLERYFGLVDRGLKAVLAGKPLLLLGVHEEINAYRRAAKYEHLLAASVDGSPEYLSVAQVEVRARQAARADYEQRADAVLAEFHDMKERFRALKDVRAILGAAAQGRVHRLCVRQDTQFAEAGEPGVGGIGFANQDLLNAAVVETLRTNGEVFELTQDRLPAAEPLAAILRY